MAYFRKTHIDGGYTPIPPEPPYNPPSPPSPPTPSAGTSPVIIRPTHSGNKSITLYYNSSDNNTLNKNITLVCNVTDIAIKSSIDVHRPVIEIKTNTDIKDSNYLYIPDFNRYYYITSVKETRPSYYIIECKVDVLMSHKDSIRRCWGVLERTATNKYNEYLPNEHYLTTKENVVIIDGGVTKKSILDSGQWILVTVGKVGNNNE